MIDKNKLRVQAKNIRRKLNIEEISVRLVNSLRQNDIYKNARDVMLFYPTKYEIDLRLLFKDDKNFYLPKVEKDNLLVCPYCNELQKSSLGIYEPCSNPINPENLDLVVVPALMADNDGYRLGYGGGFYDRFISKYGLNFKTICPIPKELFINKLPFDKYDQRMDFVIMA